MRWWLLFALLAAPIDLIPDVIPFLGCADDAIIVAATVRSLMRRAGLEPLHRDRPGTDDGPAALSQLASHSRRTPVSLPPRTGRRAGTHAHADRSGQVTR